MGTGRWSERLRAVGFVSLHVARLDCGSGGCAAAALQITLDEAHGTLTAPPIGISFGPHTSPLITRPFSIFSTHRSDAA
jgi:hypothetical protein